MLRDFTIENFNFDTRAGRVEALDYHVYGKDWPVVYLIHNDKELYIGETSSVANRMSQHLGNPERKALKQVKIIFDKEYNKSSILDIEQTLIQLYGADGMYKLQNKNGGQSRKHNYYQREKYQNKIDFIWEELHARGMTKKSIFEIRNSDAFKYSPYNSLNEEQAQLCIDVLKDMLVKLNNGVLNATTLIQGGAGTGKSVVMINMIHQLIKLQNYEMDFSEDGDDLNDLMKIKHLITSYLQENNKKSLKIAFILPMTSIRKTFKKVFTLTGNGLKGGMVMGPTNIKKEDLTDQYDVIFVDEAHRLPQYKNISWRGTYKNKCEELYGKDAVPERYTTLDWIVAASKYRVLVYDEAQTIKGSDINKDQFGHALQPNPYYVVEKKYLHTQMRCQGGRDFTEYLDNIFKCSQSERKFIGNYDVKLYQDCDEMIRHIKANDAKYRLCRVVAGYSWEWISKGCSSIEEVREKGKEDIEINGKKYIWNLQNEEWILRPTAIDEIGCVHTTQGYDLNYVGIIFGREIDYKNGEITINKDLFFDKNVKIGATPEQLKTYIINAYKVMMERGIKGCYIYAYNEGLRAYLSQFF